MLWSSFSAGKTVGRSSESIGYDSLEDFGKIVLLSVSLSCLTWFNRLFVLLLPVSSAMVTIPPLMWRVGRVVGGGGEWSREGIVRGSKGRDPSPSFSILV